MPQMTDEPYTIFRETSPNEIPDIKNEPYVIVITIREDDMVHAFNMNNIHYTKQNVQTFAKILSQQRYQESGVTDAIDDCYAAICNAVCKEMLQPATK